MNVREVEFVCSRCILMSGVNVNGHQYEMHVNAVYKSHKSTCNRLLWQTTVKISSSTQVTLKTNTLLQNQFDPCLVQLVQNTLVYSSYARGKTCDVGSHSLPADLKQRGAKTEHADGLPRQFTLQSPLQTGRVQESNHHFLLS